MPVTNYYTVNGEIIAEHTTGSSRLDYLTDGLGSVIATIDQTLTVQSTARYKPFGALLSSTGTQPRFGHAGSTGSRRTNLTHADQYNQNRHLATTEGRWTTVDPLWPSELAYCYASQNPTTLADPSGQQAVDYPPMGSGPHKGSRFMQCMSSYFISHPTLSQLQACEFCKSWTGSCINCGSLTSLYPGYMRSGPSDNRNTDNILKQALRGCLKKCLGYSSDKLKECLRECGGDKVKDAFWEVFYCYSFPALCEGCEGKYPCECKERDTDWCQRCAAADFDKCMAFEGIDSLKCNNQLNIDYYLCAKRTTTKD